MEASAFLAAVRQVILYASPALYSDGALRQVDELILIRLAYFSYVERKRLELRYTIFQLTFPAIKLENKRQISLNENEMERQNCS